MHNVLAQKFGADFRTISVSAKSGFSLVQALSSSQNAATMGKIAYQLVDTAEERFWWSRLGL